MAHLAEQEVHDFFGSLPNRKTHGTVVAHLLEGCASCEEMLAARLLEVEPELTRDAIDTALLIRRSSLRRKEFQQAAVLWARLSKRTPRERLRTLERGRIARYGLVLQILDQVESAATRRRFENGADSLSFARAVIDALSRGVYGGAPIADLYLRHLVTLGHLRRQEQNFRAAAAALAEAEEVSSRAFDPLEIGRYRRIQAGFLYQIGEFEDAAKAAGVATLLYARDPICRARALMQEAAIRSYFDPQPALLKAEESLCLLLDDPQLFVWAVQITGFCLVRLHREADARALLDRHDALIREVLARDSQNRDLYFLWLEAYIHRGQGRGADAESLLAFLAGRFRQEGLNQEMLLAHIDRIELRLDSGKWKSAYALACELTPLLAEMGLRKDLLSMWATVQDGLLRRTLDLAVARDYFQRRWLCPSRSVADGTVWV